MRKSVVILSLLLLLQCGVCFAGDFEGRVRDSETVVNDVWNDAKNALRVSVSPDTGFISNQLTSDTAESGTPIVLSADATACTSVIIRALPTNLAIVYVGSSTTANSSFGYVVSKDAPAPLILPVDNVSDVYINTVIDHEGISWIATTR